MKKRERKRVAYLAAGCCVLLGTVGINFTISASNLPIRENVSMEKLCEIEQEETVNYIGACDIRYNEMYGTQQTVTMERNEYLDTHGNDYLFDSQGRLVFYNSSEDAILCTDNQAQTASMQAETSSGVSYEQGRTIAETILEEQISDFFLYEEQPYIEQNLDVWTYRYRKTMAEGVSDYAEVTLRLDGSVYNVFIVYAGLYGVTTDQQNSFDQQLEDYLEAYPNTYTDYEVNRSYYKIDGQICMMCNMTFTDGIGYWCESVMFVYAG